MKPNNRRPDLHAAKPLRNEVRDAEMVKHLQRISDLEFALHETRNACRKIENRAGAFSAMQRTIDTQAAFAIGECRALAQEALLRADNALGTNAKPGVMNLGECTLTIELGKPPADALCSSIDRLFRDEKVPSGHA